MPIMVQVSDMTMDLWPLWPPSLNLLPALRTSASLWWFQIESSQHPDSLGHQLWTRWHGWWLSGYPSGLRSKWLGGREIGLWLFLGRHSVVPPWLGAPALFSDKDAWCCRSSHWLVRFCSSHISLQNQAPLRVFELPTKKILSLSHLLWIPLVTPKEGSMHLHSCHKKVWRMEWLKPQFTFLHLRRTEVREEGVPAGPCSFWRLW